MCIRDSSRTKIRQNLRRDRFSITALCLIVAAWQGQWYAVSIETMKTLRSFLSLIHIYTENSYRLTGSLPQKPKPTAKQMAAVTLLSGGERTLTELEERGVSRAVLDNLCAKGVLECRKVNRSLDLYGDCLLYTSRCV